MTAAGDAGGGAYARLPEDLLADLLAKTPDVTAEVTDILAPALDRRADLRAAADAEGLIASAPAGVTQTVCSVDGGFAVERTIAVDIAMAVAVGVEGFAPPGAPCAWDDNQYLSFQKVLVHDVDNERLARAAMVCLEVSVVADAPHEVRVYDGSHLTPVIQLNSGLSSQSAVVRESTIQLAEHYELVDALISFVGNPQVVGMPKYDSSRDLTDLLGKMIHERIPGDDKYVTSLLLAGGEFTRPRRVPRDPWVQLHLATRGAQPTFVQGLDDALAPLVNRQLYYTYFRPFDSSPTYRLEIKPELAMSETALGTVLATLAHQSTGPFVREPYPQYLADVMAKSVGLGLSAMHAAAHLALTRQRPDLAELLVHSYRTEGL